MRTQKITTVIFILFLTAIIIVALKLRTVSDIPTLAPDDEVIKKRPDDPGGIVIPNSDSLVYEKLKSNAEKNRAINILPEPEQPIEIDRTQVTETSNTVQVVDMDSIDQILAKIEDEDPMSVLEEESKHASLNRKSSDENIEGSIMPNDIKNADTSSSDSKPNDTQNYDKIKIATSNLNIIKSDQSRYKHSKTLESSLEQGYKVQLATSLSLSDANKTWLEIQKRHGKILAGAKFLTKKIEGKKDRIFHLIMAGYYPTLNHAKLVCDKLISRKQNCIVVK
ncbi:MAG: SPOR domain-containing protein [Rickettsiales bacterium]|nr:SPOR domain-containing protein [Rickettsiales bacterium]